MCVSMSASEGGSNSNSSDTSSHKGATSNLGIELLFRQQHNWRRSCQCAASATVAGGTHLEGRNHTSSLELPVYLLLEGSSSSIRLDICLSMCATPLLLFWLAPGTASASTCPLLHRSRMPPSSLWSCQGQHADPTQAALGLLLNCWVEGSPQQTCTPSGRQHLSELGKYHKK
jgi:hypothetical protein